jgi:hypothetical protein
MTLQDQGKLAIAELIFYIPAAAIALFTCFKHGFGRSLGFFYLILLGVIRIVGSSITLYVESASHPSETLITTGVVLASVGLSPLLNALVAFIKRV